MSSKNIKIEDLKNKSRDGNSTAQYELALVILEGNAIEKDNKFEEWLKLAAEQGHRLAQLKLVELYENREHQNRLNARQWSKAICQETDVISCEP